MLDAGTETWREGHGCIAQHTSEEEQATEVPRRWFGTEWQGAVQGAEFILGMQAPSALGPQSCVVLCPSLSGEAA